MNYDDKFETMEDLINAINEAMQDSMENDASSNCDHYIRYRIEDDILEFEDTDLSALTPDNELQQPGLLSPVTVH